MSSQLPPLDLTNQPVGFQGLISFNQFLKFNPAMQSQAANLWLFNESGAGLNVVFQQSGNAHYLPAGAWGYYALAPNDGQAQVTITYLLPNPPVSQLNAVYYAPGEPLPQSFTLGNSPIGIGGTVNTSSVQTLSNEGSPPTPILIIDIGNTGLPQLLTIYNDGSFSWSIDVGGVAHTLLKGSIANLLQIGMAGDVTQVLGQLSVAQLLTAAAGITVSAGGVAVSGGTATDALSVVSASSLDNGALTTDGSGNISKSGGKLGVSSAGDFLDASGFDTILQSRGAPNTIHFRNGGGSDVATISSAGLTLFQNLTMNNGSVNFFTGSIARVGTFTGTGSGTYNHGLGNNPNWVAPIVDQSGSATQGYDSVTSSQVHVTLGASLAFKAYAIR